MRVLLVLLVVLSLGLVAGLIMMRRKKVKDKVPKNLSVKQSRPRGAAPPPVVDAASVQDKISLQSMEITLPVMELPADPLSEPAEMAVNQEVISSSSCVDREEKEPTPEDSTLRRHYLSTQRAEKEAILHPYPTDSTLRRHRDSMSAISLNKPAVAGKVENAEPAIKKMHIPEDSALRRHFLTQVQAEVESQLCSRPTDATLRRHYDNQVKAIMEEYLLNIAA